MWSCERRVCGVGDGAGVRSHRAIATVVAIPGAAVEAAPTTAFQWEDALVGALAGAGMILLVGGVALVVRRHREHAVAVS